MSVLRADGVRYRYTVAGQPPLSALNGIDLELSAGEAVGVLGRSGSGKSTLLGLLLALLNPTAGTVTLDDQAVVAGPVGRLRWYRRRVQYVPQDAAGSLDPRLDVARLVGDPLRRLQVAGNHRDLVLESLDAVGLGSDLVRRRPAELSGGQAQRVALARAVATGAELLLTDEPVSGLDLPLRNQVLGLLDGLRRERGVGLLFVSHDLDAVARLCPHSIVLDAGHVVERGETTRLLAQPESAAAQALVSSLPRLADARGRR